jgi:hypothetical protein
VLEAREKNVKHAPRDGETEALLVDGVIAGETTLGTNNTDSSRRLDWHEPARHNHPSTSYTDKSIVVRRLLDGKTKTRIEHWTTLARERVLNPTHLHKAVIPCPVVLLECFVDPKLVRYVIVWQRLEAP